LLMSNFQANLRALFSKDISLSALVEKLNERVMATAKGEKFITMFIGRYNNQTRKLEYVNAGHNPPFIFVRNSGKIIQLSSGCVGLGMIDEIPIINQGVLNIDEQSTLLCYTDGLVETIDGDRVVYNTSILEKNFSRNQNVQQIINTIAQVRESGADVFDDISILGFDFE